jgi:hypothetical protein
MVLRCGRKPSGEEVSVSLDYALGLRTDQTIMLYNVRDRNQGIMMLYLYIYLGLGPI